MESVGMMENITQGMGSVIQGIAEAVLIAKEATTTTTTATTTPLHVPTASMAAWAAPAQSFSAESE